LAERERDREWPTEADHELVDYVRNMDPRHSRLLAEARQRVEVITLLADNLRMHAWQASDATREVANGTPGWGKARRRAVRNREHFADLLERTLSAGKRIPRDARVVAEGNLAHMTVWTCELALRWTQALAEAERVRALLDAIAASRSSGSPREWTLPIVTASFLRELFALSPVEGAQAWAGCAYNLRSASAVRRVLPEHARRRPFKKRRSRK
jgi:hypothetical protein